MLQSQRIDVVLGGEAEVTTDFTLSTRMADDLDAIAARPRVTIIANERPARPAS